MKLKPLHNSILFVFFDDTAGVGFISKTRSGILMTNQDMSLQTIPRWGRVVAVGPEVETVKSGQYILIEPLMWTMGFEYDEVKIWKTDESKVMGITDDINSCIQF